jgi:nitrous oxide reductase accessory protein NosL
MTGPTSQTKIKKKNKPIKFSNFIPFHFISFHHLPNNPKKQISQEKGGFFIFYPPFSQ